MRYDYRNAIDSRQTDSAWTDSVWAWLRPIWELAVLVRQGFGSGERQVIGDHKFYFGANYLCTAVRPLLLGGRKKKEFKSLKLINLKGNFVLGNLRELCYTYYVLKRVLCYNFRLLLRAFSIKSFNDSFLSKLHYGTLCIPIESSSSNDKRRIVSF